MLAVSLLNMDMKDNYIDAELTAALHAFLQKRGYTHIIALGIEPKEMNDAAEPETPKENYWLEPLKAQDQRLNQQEPDHRLMAITAPDMIEMLNGADDIQYMIRVPLVDYNDYLAKR